MKQWILSLLASLMVASHAHAGDAQGAKQFVDQVASQVLGVLKTDASASAKLEKMQAIFSGVVDIPFIGKYVLGTHWRQASDAQKQAYLAAYEPFVIKNYAGKLTKYSGQKYTLKAPRQAGSNYIVTMEIVDAGKPSVFVDYRLREDAGTYKVIDISVEGVSLVQTQRSEFNAIVSSKGIDYLTAAMKKKAAA